MDVFMKGGFYMVKLWLLTDFFIIIIKQRVKLFDLVNSFCIQKVDSLGLDLFLDVSEFGVLE